MNAYLDATCRSMMTQLNVFDKTCEMSALKDDGAISKAETKTLKRLLRASNKFKAELTKAMSN